MGKTYYWKLIQFDMEIYQRSKNIDHLNYARKSYAIYKELGGKKEYKF